MSPVSRIRRTFAPLVVLVLFAGCMGLPAAEETRSATLHDARLVATLDNAAVLVNATLDEPATLAVYEDGVRLASSPVTQTGTEARLLMLSTGPAWGRDGATLVVRAHPGVGDDANFRENLAEKTYRFDPPRLLAAGPLTLEIQDYGVTGFRLNVTNDGGVPAFLEDGDLRLRTRSADFQVSGFFVSVLPGETKELRFMLQPSLDLAIGPGLARLRLESGAYDAVAVARFTNAVPLETSLALNYAPAVVTATAPEPVVTDTGAVTGLRVVLETTGDLPAYVVDGLYAHEDADASRVHPLGIRNAFSIDGMLRTGGQVLPDRLLPGSSVTLDLGPGRDLLAVPLMNEDASYYPPPGDFTLRGELRFEEGPPLHTSLDLHHAVRILDARPAAWDARGLRTVEVTFEVTGDVRANVHKFVYGFSEERSDRSSFGSLTEIVSAQRAADPGTHTRTFTVPFMTPVRPAHPTDTTLSLSLHDPRGRSLATLDVALPAFEFHVSDVNASFTCWSESRCETRNVRVHAASTGTTPAFVERFIVRIGDEVVPASSVRVEGMELASRDGATTVYPGMSATTVAKGTHDVRVEALYLDGSKELVYEGTVDAS